MEMEQQREENRGTVQFKKLIWAQKERGEETERRIEVNNISNKFSNSFSNSMGKGNSSYVINNEDNISNKDRESSNKNKNINKKRVQLIIGITENLKIKNGMEERGA